MRAQILAAMLSLSPDSRGDYHQIAEAIDKAAFACSVDPMLLIAIAWTESRFDSEARGKHGEIGLFQVRQKALADLERQLKLGGTKPTISAEGPKWNAYAAGCYLATRKGSWLEKIRRYNGSGPRSRGYVAKVSELWMALRERQAKRAA